MSTRFVIVGAARTGSTLLVRTLNSIDGVCCHGELLAQHATGLQGLETNLARAAAAAATAATPAAAAHPTAAPAPAGTSPTTPTVPAVIAESPAGASAVHRAIAVSCLGAAWSVVLWWKTGSVALAMGMSVAATALSTLLARKSGPLA